MKQESFGQYAKRLRLPQGLKTEMKDARKGLGLREAARLLGVSAAYLSQVEADDVPPSLRLITAMARVYGRPLAEIQNVADQVGIARRTPKTPMQSINDLRALYRMGGMFTADELETMIRHTLGNLGLSAEEIEAEIALLRADLPRIRKQGRDNLFAAEIKPRFLSKRDIARMADQVLAKNGLGPGSYQPPTPVELMVEKEEGVSYLIAQLPSTDGDPVVLGRTRRNGSSREITINTDLADSDKESDIHRFRFTLGHEFFHAIEHLRLPSNRVSDLRRTAAQEIGFIERAAHRRISAAERAVNLWVRTEKPRVLDTPEDWREWQANTFASALLMPAWAVRDTFEKRFGAQCICVSPGEKKREVALEAAGEILSGGKVYLKSIAQQFGVSRQAMAIRLLELELVQEVTG